MRINNIKYQDLTDKEKIEITKAYFLSHADKTEPYSVKVLGHEFFILPGVFDPSHKTGSILLAKNQNVKQYESVLDVGTGSGLQAKIASEISADVTAIDPSPKAVTCAKHNLPPSVNVYKMDFDGYISAIKKSQNKKSLKDVIIANLPFTALQPPKGLYNRANAPTIINSLFDPGMKILGSFLRDSPSVLKEDGRIMLLYSNLGDIAGMHELLDNYCWNINLIAKKSKGKADFMVYELTRRK